MSRWNAAAIHCSISALIAVIVGILVFGAWYPPPYSHAAGADQLISLLVGVSLAIGPLLTLIVFRAGKRGLKFDLAFIGLAQSVAFIYGMFVILQSRPVFLVGVLDRFVLVSANEIADRDLALGNEPRFRSRSWTGPRLVAAQLPTDPKERNALVSSALSGPDIQNLPRYYCDYDRAGKALLARAKPLAALRMHRPESSHVIDQWLAGSGHSDASVVWLPLQARKADLVMLLDANDAQPLQALAIDPW